MELTPDVDPDEVAAYDYDLPTDRIATHPSDSREGARLLVHVGAGRELKHRRFSDLGDELVKGDLLVFNNTRVIPARLQVQKPTGGKVEIFVISCVEAWGAPGSTGTIRFRCMTRSSKPLRAGTELRDPSRPALPALIVEEAQAGEALVAVEWTGSPLSLLEEFGEIPLPPYIVKERERQGLPAEAPQDAQRYQTVYAREAGAVAAPTAGLHFSEALLQELRAREVQTAELTLTVGPGTFQPVRADRLSEHPMHRETYTIPETLGPAIQGCHDQGGRVIPVGTTSARTLEAEMLLPEPFLPGRRSTDIFLRPGVPFRICDGLITNFHLPRSTLLALVAALVGYQEMLRIYGAAIQQGYRFYSYGDSSLLFRALENP